MFETMVRAAEVPSCSSCGSAELDKPAACGTCGHPGGPGARAAD